MLVLSSKVIASDWNIGVTVHKTFIFEIIGFIIFLLILYLIYRKIKSEP